MLGSLRLHLILIFMASAAACGIELQINPDRSTDGGVTPDPGTSSSGGASSSSGDGTSSSSSGAPTSSSSSSSSGSVADAGGDAEVPDPCTGAFVLGSSQIAMTDPCVPSAQCAGVARRDNQRILLTKRDTVTTDAEAGVYWRPLGLGRNARFRLIVDVAARQPDDAADGDGGIVGHGFAFAFVQDEDGSPNFPTARQDRASQMGINELPGFFGAAAYVQTYDGANRPGVLALRTTAIPSTNPPDSVDGYSNGVVGNAEKIQRKERTFLRFEIDGYPNQDPSVKMLRLTSADDNAPRVIETKSIPLPANLTQIDYFGVAASRGPDNYSQSGHWLTSLALSCPAP